jgi:ankyrin repeat protein
LIRPIQLHTYSPYLHPNTSIAQDTGNTALHIATQNELPEFVSVFLQRFGQKLATSSSTSPQAPLAWCDVNAQNRKGNTPLHMAVEFGLLECKAILLSGGARHDICNNDGHPAIRGASGKFGLNDLAYQVQERRNQKRWSLGDSQNKNSSPQVPNGPTGSSGVPL